MEATRPDMHTGNRDGLHKAEEDPPGCSSLTGDGDQGGPTKDAGPA
jgi:hypothetical protein